MAPNPKHKHTICSGSDDDTTGGSMDADAADTTATSILATSTGTTTVAATANSSKRKSTAVSSVASYIPNYLKEFVRPHHGDFCYTPYFHPKLIAQLMMEGFLPIACTDFVLPKLHDYRCVIPLRQKEQQIATSSNGTAATSGLHIGKQVRKKSKRYTISINQCFDRVVGACRYQHGEHCWLYPPLVRAFAAIHDRTTTTASGDTIPVTTADGADTGITNSTARDAPSSSTSPASNNTRIGDGFLTKTTTGQTVPVRLYSIEVWNAETGALAAGELGYTVGSIFTSLTGFSVEDSAGSIQLATLGTLLLQNGFTIWDLGMEMAYKTALGSSLIPRGEFVRLVHQSRLTDTHLRLVRNATDGCCSNSEQRLGCRDILDSTRISSDLPIQQLTQQQQNSQSSPPSKKSKCSSQEMQP